MKIVYKSKKLQRDCNDPRKRQKRFGADQAKILNRRLMQMKAAETWNIFYELPGTRCHPLQGTRKGQHATDVKQPFRIIFEPHGDPIPEKQDGSIDFAEVTTILINEVVDYHGD